MILDQIYFWIALLTAFGGLGLAVTAENKDSIIIPLGIFGTVAFALCTAVVLATMSYQHCAQYQQMCAVDHFFRVSVGFPSADEGTRTKAFVATGWVGGISMYFLLALAIAKSRAFRLLSFLGATALMCASSAQLYLWVVS